MMALSHKQKENVAKIFINIGSITFGGVVLGFFVSDNKISEAEFLYGIVGVILSFFISIFIDK